jgi:hypothetical protein
MPITIVVGLEKLADEPLGQRACLVLVGRAGLGWLEVRAERIVVEVRDSFSGRDTPRFPRCVRIARPR